MVAQILRCDRRLAAENDTDAPLSLLLGDNPNQQKTEKHIRSTVTGNGNGVCRSEKKNKQTCIWFASICTCPVDDLLWRRCCKMLAMLRGPVTSPFSDKEGKQKDKIPEKTPWKRRFLLETIKFSRENVSFQGVYDPKVRFQKLPAPFLAIASVGEG